VYGVAAIVNIVYLITLKNVSFKPNFDRIEPKLRKDFLFYSLFIITTTLVGAITPSLNTFFISVKMGLVFTGVFSIANYITAFIEIPYRSLGSIVQPQISQAIKDNDMKTTNYLCQGVALHQLLAGSFIILAIWINIDLLFAIMPNGEEYAAGKYVVLILGFSRLFSATYSVGTTVLGYSKYYYYSLFFTFLLTGLAIFLNLILIPIIGINGAAVASLVSTLVYTLLLLLLIKIKLQTTPFNIKQLFIVLIVLALYALSMLWDLTLTKTMLQIPLKDLYTQIINGVLKTTTLLLLGSYVVVKMRISPEINKILINFNSTKQIFRK
jgi:O-antigen/teichoic acid export membrane protein